MSLTPTQLRLLEILEEADQDNMTVQEIIDVDPYLTHHSVADAALGLSRRGLVIKHNPVAIPTRALAFSISIAGHTTLTTLKESPRARIIRSNQNRC